VPTDVGFSEEDLREMVLRLAHEIRNPLATIKSAVQLFEHLHNLEGDDGQFLTDILTEVSRIDQVVKDMQLFVRLDAQPTAPGRVAEAVATAVEAERKDALAAYGTSILNEEGRDVMVLADTAQLETALRELISNAVRFSPPGSTVRVAWRPVEPFVVAISVTDQGPGISSENQDRVLRPFFSTSTRGTGLGLNIASRIATLAGGRLEWENLASGGSRFSLVLPAQ